MVRVQSFWASRSSQQRIYLGVGLALTIAVAAFLGKMVATPEYKLLMSGLEPADAQAITAELAAKKIPYLVSPDGTSVTVPADQVDAARLEVASQPTPHSGRIGFEIFDKVSWGQTEFDEKVNYQRALEGELERTIQTMSNVQERSRPPGDGDRLRLHGPGARGKGLGNVASKRGKSLPGRDHANLPAGSGRG